MSATKLHAVPTAALRGMGLIRVSDEGDRGENLISPDVQRAAILQHATSNGIEIVAWLEGIDESGSRAKSPWWAKLEQAVAGVESGKYDVIVVWKYSRSARQRLKWATMLDRVDAAGGRIESATEQFDTTTSTGRFARGMVGELNAFFAEQIGEGWKEAHANRIRQGKPPSGKPKWGYVYDKDQKLHVPDPETGPVLADVYARYVAGESIYQLVRWLNSNGHRTLIGGLWSDRSLRRVLDSGFAAGLFLAGGDQKRNIAPTLHQGVHEPLISPDLWQAYLDARKARSAAPARRERSQYVLSGLLRCARCGGSMVAGQFGVERKQPKYRCKTSKEQGVLACTGGYVTARFVEEAVLEWLQELTEEMETRKAAALASRATRKTARDDTRRLNRQVKKAEEALTRLAVSNASDPLPPQVYRQAQAELTEQLVQLRAALEDAELVDRRTVLNPGRVARGLLAGWETRPVAYRRTELATILAYVEVTTGRPQARFRPVPVWEAE